MASFNPKLSSINLLYWLQNKQDHAVWISCSSKQNNQDNDVTSSWFTKYFGMQIIPFKAAAH